MSGQEEKVETIIQHIYKEVKNDATETIIEREYGNFSTLKIILNKETKQLSFKVKGEEEIDLDASDISKASALLIDNDVF